MPRSSQSSNESCDIARQVGVCREEGRSAVARTAWCKGSIDERVYGSISIGVGSTYRGSSLNSAEESQAGKLGHIWYDWSHVSFEGSVHASRCLNSLYQCSISSNKGTHWNDRLIESTQYKNIQVVWSSQLEDQSTFGLRRITTS